MSWRPAIIVLSILDGEQDRAWSVRRPEGGAAAVIGEVAGTSRTMMDYMVGALGGSGHAAAFNGGEMLANMALISAMGAPEWTSTR